MKKDTCPLASCYNLRWENQQMFLCFHFNRPTCENLSSRPLTKPLNRWHVTFTFQPSVRVLPSFSLSVVVSSYQHIYTFCQHFYTRFKAVRQYAVMFYSWKEEGRWQKMPCFHYWVVEDLAGWSFLSFIFSTGLPLGAYSSRSMTY